MDVAKALADLTEISTQVEAAVIFDQSGEIAGSTLADEERSQRIARSALELVSAAGKLERAGTDGVVQIDATMQDGSVFVVCEGDRSIAATTGVEPTVGLVFYDLKSCLRSLASAETKPRPRRTKAAAEPSDAQP